MELKFSVHSTLDIFIQFKLKSPSLCLKTLVFLNHIVMLELDALNFYLTSTIFTFTLLDIILQYSDLTVEFVDRNTILVALILACWCLLFPWLNLLHEICLNLLGFWIIRLCNQFLLSQLLVKCRDARRQCLDFQVCLWETGMDLQLSAVKITRIEI